MTTTAGIQLLRLTFLGTSAAQPTAERNLSGLAVKAGRELLLFDCGEGTQRQMVRFGTGFEIDAVFFTHFHADHYLGIIGFLRTAGMQGRTRPMHLYGPAPALRLLHRAIHLGIDAHTFPVEIHELAGGDEVRRDGFRIHAVEVRHRVPGLGYLLVEDTRPGPFDAQKALELGLAPGPDYMRLQRGERVATPDGGLVRPEDVLGASRPGRRVVISGDTEPCEALREAARDCDLLVHEATFSDAERDRAALTLHSTARGAARLAREAGARRLVLTHLSARFENDTSVLEREAREEFDGPLEIARDGLVLEVERRG